LGDVHCGLAGAVAFAFVTRVAACEGLADVEEEEMQAVDFVCQVVENTEAQSHFLFFFSCLSIFETDIFDHNDDVDQFSVDVISVLVV
jgi:hypothetical protein